MDYCALRRKSRVLRPRTALKEEQIIHFLLMKHIIQRRSLECKQFSASGIFYFLRQDYRIFRKEKIKGKNAVRRFLHAMPDLTIEFTGAKIDTYFWESEWIETLSFLSETEYKNDKVPLICKYFNNRY